MPKRQAVVVAVPEPSVAALVLSQARGPWLACSLALVAAQEHNLAGLGRDSSNSHVLAVRT